QSMYEQCLKLFRNTMTLDCNILQQFNSVKLLDVSPKNSWHSFAKFTIPPHSTNSHNLVVNLAKIYTIY
ncbi:MAG: hypothetical protein O7C60_02620, partial [Rickettsia endosymbiont of Ixodes persulcatus]|nr:hypothetical protein [Rickettsia endosymbiont of Ixodes persulcatus]